MGVQGLTSLLESRGDILQDRQFRRSKLVIDGYNLLYLLYRNSGLDQNHGGEYAAFKNELKMFVAALKECGISPYVLLDGGSDPSDRKLETSNQRAADRIKKANNAALTGKKEGVLPPLIREVFIQTLNRLEVPLAQCYREADPEIAALATEWQCPVLSDDSDFYIFKLPAGMLPIKHFQWKRVKKGGDNSYIPCKNYSTSRFCKSFKLDEKLLPVFAMLGGNDYVKLQQLDWSQFLPLEPRLKGLLYWLKCFKQPGEALEAALELLTNQGEEIPNDLKGQMTMAMKEYQAPVSVINMFFDGVTPPPLPPTEQDLIPDWMRLPLTQGQLMSEVLDVLVLKRRFLSISVEKAKLPSSNLCSRPLRQLTYGLLLGGESDLVVEERDRNKFEVQLFEVKPTITTQRLPLATLHEADPSDRLQVLLEALGVSKDSLSQLSPQERLPVAVTCYWLENAQPTPDKTLVGALLQGIMGNQKAGAAASSPHANIPDLVHLLNQWQACLRDAMSLNQLLNFPLQEPEVASLFQGTLILKLLSSTDVQQDDWWPTVVASVRQWSESAEAQSFSLSLKI